MSDPRLYEWIALRRVHEGGVAKSAGVYLDHGRPVPHYMTAVVDQLVWSGLLTVADGDPLWQLRRLSLTDAGQAQYTQLCQQRQRAELPMLPAEFATPTTQTPAGCRPSAAPLAPPGGRPDPTWPAPAGAMAPPRTPSPQRVEPGADRSAILNRSREATVGESPNVVIGDAAAGPGQASTQL